MIHTVQPRHGAFWLARLLRPAAWAEQIFLAERLTAVVASPQQIHKIREVVRSIEREIEIPGAFALTL